MDLVAVEELAEEERHPGQGTRAAPLPEERRMARCLGGVIMLGLVLAGSHSRPRLSIGL